MSICVYNLNRGDSNNEKVNAWFWWIEFEKKRAYNQKNHTHSIIIITENICSYGYNVGT